MLRIFTVGVGVDCELLKQNCKAINSELTVLGETLDIKFQYGHKLILIYDYLKTLDPNDIVLYLDGVDSLIIGSQKEITTKFKSFNTPFICCAEHFAAPIKEYANLHPITNTPYRFLNSGLFMGYAGYILDWFTKNNAEGLVPSDNDQAKFQEWYFKDYNALKLDTNCVLFQNIQKEITELENEFYFSNKRLYNRITNTRPPIIHFPGYKHVINYTIDKILRS